MPYWKGSILKWANHSLCLIYFLSFPQFYQNPLWRGIKLTVKCYLLHKNLFKLGKDLFQVCKFSVPWFCCAYILSFLRTFPLYLVNYAQNEEILNYKNDIERALDFSKFERLFNQIMNKEAECFTAHLLNTTENATAFWLSNV